MSFADPYPRVAIAFDTMPESDGILKRFLDGFGGVGGDPPKAALFFNSYGRRAAQDRNFRHSFGCTDGTFQFSSGISAPTPADPLRASTTADDTRALYLPGVCEAVFDSFEDDSVLLNFTDGQRLTPRAGVVMLGGDDLEVSMGMLNCPTQDAGVEIPHGLSGAPDGFLFFSTGRAHDGNVKGAGLACLGAASWNGVAISQWCHQYFIKDNVSTTLTAGALLNNRVGAGINLTTGATNDYTLELTQAAGVFSITPRSGSPSTTGDIVWIALKGALCNAAIVDLPETTDADWTISSLPSGEPPMFGLLISTLLTSANSINTGGNGASFCVSLLRESITPSFSYWLQSGKANPGNGDCGSSGIDTAVVNFLTGDGSEAAFNIEDKGVHFTATGFTVPAEFITNVTTGPRKAALFAIRGPAIDWLQDPAVDFHQGTALCFNAVANCDGVVSAMLVADGASAPNATTIIAAAQADLDLAPQQRTTFTGPAIAYDFFEAGIIGLTGGAAYDLYVVLADNAGRKTSPIKLDITMTANPAAIKTFTISRISRLVSSLLLDTPPLPIWGFLNWFGTSLTPPHNGIPAAQRVWSLDEEQTVATNYRGFTAQWGAFGSNQPPTAALDRIRATNLAFKVTRYENSSYSVDAFANPPEVELDRGNNILLHRTAQLNGPIDNSQTTIPLTYTGAIGLRDSTSVTDFTTSINDYVIYIQIGSERIRVNTTDVFGNITDCERGWDGTDASSHIDTADVLTPIYIGSADGLGDWHPASGADVHTVRYALKVDQQSVSDLSFMTPAIINGITEGGRDGAWLDIFAPSFFNMVDANGNTVVPWNTATDDEMTAQERRDTKLAQLNIIQGDIFEALGDFPYLIANNMKSTFDEADGGFEEYFNALHPINVGNIEGLFTSQDVDYVPQAEFDATLGVLCKAIQRGYGVSADSTPVQETSLVPKASALFTAKQYYDFASIMLGWETSNAASIIFALMIVDPEGDVAPGEFEFNLPDVFYYDIGTPVSPQADEDDITPLRCAEYGATNHIYRRRWLRAYTAVNPSSTNDSIPHTLPADRHWRGFVDGIDRTTLQLNAHTALILFAWDFEVDDDSIVGAAVGTLVNDFGNDPYTFAIIGDAGPFAIHATTGVITLTATVTHDPTVRYALNVRITDDDDATLDVEVLIITKP